MQVWACLRLALSRETRVHLVPCSTSLMGTISVSRDAELADPLTNQVSPALHLVSTAELTLLMIT